MKIRGLKCIVLYCSGKHVIQNTNYFLVTVFMKCLVITTSPQRKVNSAKSGGL